HPFVLAEEPLLHVIGNRDHIEARLAGVELDDCFLPLLLLGNHLGADRDAGHVLEFLVILGEQIAARALDEEHLDLLALEFLPVERAVRMYRELAPSGYGAQRRGAQPRLQQTATLALRTFRTIVISHGSLLCALR